MMFEHQKKEIHIFVEHYQLHNPDIAGSSHPDPGPMANVQGWEQRASLFWRCAVLFFWEYTFLRRSSDSQTLLFSEMTQ